MLHKEMNTQITGSYSVIKATFQTTVEMDSLIRGTETTGSQIVGIGPVMSKVFNENLRVPDLIIFSWMWHCRHSQQELPF